MMMPTMKNEIQLFFTALTYFTRLPCGAWGKHSEQDLNHAAKYFPLVGVVVGSVAAAVFVLASWMLPVALAVLLSMVATLLLTGAFHEDGLSDTADGLGGGWDKEQILTIMKDSRIGNYGAAALFMALLIKFQALTYIPVARLPIVLIVAHSVSRFASTLLAYTQSYVRENGKAKPIVQHISSRELVVAALFGLGPLALLNPHFWWALLPLIPLWLWFSHKLKKLLGGYTGDCLGAMQQLCEVTFYLGVVACVSH
jgi:adenosylcobinamide-GDP ribazoletransferase